MKEGWKIILEAVRNIDRQMSEEDGPGRKWLQKCLARNALTDYGRRYGFDKIINTDEYRSRVPISGYEDIAPLVEAMAQGASDVTFAGSPVAFEKTGGSAGGEKLIPYSRESLLDFRSALLPWLGSLIEIYGLGKGSAYMAISPAMRTAATTLSGVPIGLSDGAYLGGDILRAFAEISAVPISVASIAEFESWQLATLYWLLRAGDLELISVWSPTFMLQLLEGIERRHSDLQRLLKSGGRLNGEAFPPDPDAADRLSAYDGKDASRLWPALKMISCWTDASSAVYADLLSQKMPRAQMQGKGLLLTEGVVTVPDVSGNPLPARRSGFWEFLDGKGHSRLETELEKGEIYEVLMTTSGGLYRYRSGDTVRCDGYSDDRPVLRFSGRNGAFSDLVGEKLSDAFVTDCMRCADCAGMLIPLQTPRAGYLLLTENDEFFSDDGVKRLETALCRNPQYAYARRIGQLAPLKRQNVPRLAARYTEFAVRRGRRLGDVKIPALCADPDWRKEIPTCGLR